MRRYLRIYPGCALLAVLAVAAVAAASDEAPAWLRQAASRPIPPYDDEVPAVFILHERRITVDENGRQKSEERGALKILKKEGRDHARAAAWYVKDIEKIHEINAWLILRSGATRSYGKKDQVDVSASGDTAYDEIRVKGISAEQDADVGAVFGYEVSSEEVPLFSQIEWHFQSRLPVLQSRIILGLPKAWRAEAITFNSAAIKPSLAGSEYVWELRDLPFVKSEPASPSLTSLVPRLGINYFPPDGAGRASGKTFRTWADVSSWGAELHEPRATVNDAMTAKVRELTSTAKTETERIGAIARFVQSIRYVSIQTGVGRGGGYTPHPAVDTFAKSYGDCKDKATLMRAMLKVVGIQSYPVLIYLGDPEYVREAWPSPQQFNHAIVAIRITDEKFAGMTLDRPGSERLSFFDPTDPETRYGDLPQDEQGSLALVVSGSDGALVRMPSAGPEVSRLERQIDASITEGGTITGVILESWSGQYAADSRREYRNRPVSEYRKLVERWLTDGMAGTRMLKLEPSDGSADGGFGLRTEFVANGYAQLMQKHYLVFKPVLVSRHDDLTFIESSRANPVVLEPRAFIETSTFKLPAGFTVDELPEKTRLESSFGFYTTNFETQENRLLLTRRLTIMRGTIPADQYPRVRKFFADMRAAEQAPVVLAKK